MGIADRAAEAKEAWVEEDEETTVAKIRTNST